MRGSNSSCRHHHHHLHLLLLPNKRGGKENDYSVKSSCCHHCHHHYFLPWLITRVMERVTQQKRDIPVTDSSSYSYPSSQQIFIMVVIRIMWRRWWCNEIIKRNCLRKKHCSSQRSLLRQTTLRDNEEKQTIIIIDICWQNELKFELLTSFPVSFLFFFNLKYFSW